MHMILVQEKQLIDKKWYDDNVKGGVNVSSIFLYARACFLLYSLTASPKHS